MTYLGHPRNISDSVTQKTQNKNFGTEIETLILFTSSITEGVNLKKLNFEIGLTNYFILFSIWVKTIPFQFYVFPKTDFIPVLHFSWARRKLFENKKITFVNLQSHFQFPPGAL